jgi:hypothetical protein
MVNQQGFLEELIDGIDLKTEEDVGLLVDERNRLDRRLREIRGEIERYIDVLGQEGANILPLVEEKVKSLQVDETLILRRRDDLTLQLQGTPHLIDAQILINHLEDFAYLMALAAPEEKAQILQLVLKDVRVSKESLTLNIYDFSSLTITGEGLKNRTEWLPVPRRLADQEDLRARHQRRWYVITRHPRALGTGHPVVAKPFR